MTHRIDTHQHFVPPSYAKWLASRGVDAGGMRTPEWTVEQALSHMEVLGISTAILSLSTPGVHLGDDAEARERAREMNEFAAGVVRQFPGRFGFFAVLPLPDVEGAIAEARHALGRLEADGVVLLANAAQTYVGDPRWDPLMAELAQRNAVVFIHPSALAADPVPGIPAYAADFLLDTTRAAISLCRNGVLDRYPSLRILLSHAGGFVPFAAERMAQACSPESHHADGLRRLRQFHYDVAVSSSPYALSALLAFADGSRITYGSDWPYASTRNGRHFARLLDEFPLPVRQRQAIERENALALFPRLGRAGP